MAGYAMLRQADDVCTNYICNGAALAARAMLEDVLNDEVAILMPAKRCRVTQNLLDERLCLIGRAMFDQTLEDTATKLVASNVGPLAMQLCGNKLDALWWHGLNELLENIVCMRRLHTLVHAAMELLDELLLICWSTNIYGLLHDAATSFGQC